jgi:NTE family protein
MNSKTLFFVLALLVCATAVSTAEDSSVSAPGRRPVVALALEGGGALGLAHIGVIRVLEEAGIPIDIVTGTSMGAIVGGLYAQGFSVPELERLATETDWLYLFSEYSVTQNESYRVLDDWRRNFLSVGITSKNAVASGGLLKGNRILTYMDALVSRFPPSIDFDDLPRRYRAVATDFTSGEEVVLSRGSLAEAMRASMGIPGVFAPYALDNRLLIDGGIVNNLPAALARSMGADLVIAVDLAGGFQTSGGYLDLSPLENLSRTVDLILEANVARQLEHADFVITVPLKDFTPADFGRGTEIMMRGLTTAQGLREEITLVRDQILGKRNGISLPVSLSDDEIQTEKQTVAGFRYSGGTPAEQKIVRRALDPLAGTVIEPDELARRIVDIYSEYALEQIRVRRMPSEEYFLAVEIEPTPPRGHNVRMGLTYGGTYSDSISSKLQVTQGVVLRDIIWPGLELAVDVEILGALGIEASGYQPLGSRFYIESRMLLRTDFDTYYSSDGEESSVDYIFYESAARIAGFLGLYPFPGSRTYLGISREWIDTTAASLFLPELEERHILMAQAGFDLLRLDSPIFPMQGAAVELLLQQGLSYGSSTREFSTFSAFAEGHIPLNRYASLGYILNSGMDFSGNVDSTDSAPFIYKPELGNRRLFPNPLSAQERFGSFVLGNGVELNIRLDNFQRAIPLPLFGRLHFASGLVYRDFDSLSESSPVSHWNSSAGLGLRINDGFGLLLRGGMAGGDISSLSPYFAIDIGSMTVNRL